MAENQERLSEESFASSSDVDVFLNETPEEITVDNLSQGSIDAPQLEISPESEVSQYQGIETTAEPEIDIDAYLRGDLDDQTTELSSDFLEAGRRGFSQSLDGIGLAMTAYVDDIPQSERIDILNNQLEQKSKLRELYPDDWWALADKDFWAETLASQVGPMVGGVGAGMATGPAGVAIGPATGVTLFSLQGAGGTYLDTYADALSQGLSPNKAEEVARRVAWKGGALEGLSGLIPFLGKFGNKVIGRVAGKAGTGALSKSWDALTATAKRRLASQAGAEFLQEAGTEILIDAAKYMEGLDVDLDLDRYARVGVTGGVVGGAMGGTQELGGMAIDRLRGEQEAEVSPDVPVELEPEVQVESILPPEVEPTPEVELEQPQPVQEIETPKDTTLELAPQDEPVVDVQEKPEPKTADVQSPATEDGKLQERDEEIPEGVTALNKRFIKQIRESGSMEDMSTQDKQSFQESINRAVTVENSSNANQLAEELSKSPRAITMDEHASMVVEEANLENKYDQLTTEAQEAYDAGNVELGDQRAKSAEATLEQIDKITYASSLAGTEAGRALAARRIAIEKKAYNLVNMTKRATQAKRGKLSKEDNAYLKKMDLRLKESNSKIKKLEEDLKKANDSFDRAMAERVLKEQRQDAVKLRSIKRGNLRAKREGLKNKLIETTGRANTLGMDFDQASLVSQIAVTHIQEGALNLQDVISKVRGDLEGTEYSQWTDEQLIKAIGGRVKSNEKKVRSEISKRIGDMKSQARLEDKINQALKGAWDVKVKKRQTPAKIKNLQAKLRTLSKMAHKNVKDANQLEKVNSKIDEIEAALAIGSFPKKASGKPRDENPDIKTARKKYNELVSLMNAKESIADLKNQLETGEYKVSVPQQRIIQNERLERALIEKRNLQRKVDERIENLKPWTAGRALMEALYASRAAKATADMSAFLRQGWLLSLTRPKASAKSFGKAFRAAVDLTGDYADKLDIEIRKDPMHLERERAKLYLSDPEGRINKREELFMSSLIERIPVIKHVVKASNRNMTTYLNLMRATVFDDFVRNNPDATLEEKRAYADYVNKASGRGNLGQTQKAAKVLSTVFFAPKYAASRFQAPATIIQNWKKPKVRKAIARDMLGSTMVGATVLALAGMAGLEVGDDPEKSDFGKIIAGDTRIDIWGGFQQPASLIMRGLGTTAMDRAGIRDLVSSYGQDPATLGGKFLSYKLAPTITIPLELARGENIIGEERSAPETMLRAYAPIILESAYDIYNNDRDFAKTAGMAGLEFLGVGVQEHANKSSKGGRTSSRSSSSRTSSR